MKYSKLIVRYSPAIFAFHFALVTIEFVVRSAHEFFDLFALLIAQGRGGTVVRRDGHDFLPARVHLEIAFRPANETRFRSVKVSEYNPEYRPQSILIRYTYPGSLTDTDFPKGGTV